MSVGNTSYRALRLTATETNMAYRMSDFLRRQRLPFVIGIIVHLNPLHPRPDICDHMTGRYPPTFLFLGWHPLCFCFSTSVLAKKTDFIRILKDGGEFRKITTIPKTATTYIANNLEAVKKTLFYKDNFK